MGSHNDIVLPNLPIQTVLPELLERLRERGRVVLEAPPGAGKTTLVPIALQRDPERKGEGKIVMLEPRRLAVRGAAWRIAELLGEEPGGLVGYRMRGESRVGPRTRIEILTEGVLTGMMRDNPELADISTLIFDEFHERSIHADLGLALALHAAEIFRPDLQIVVMSATLDGNAVAELLGGAPIVRSEGKVFPVETRYAGRNEGRRVEEDVAGLLRRIRGETSGDLLVFLPGAGEIDRTAALLADLEGVEVHRLHGRLSREEQSRAILPSATGERKVVLATSIAETSLTIEGIEVVVDAGLRRGPRFDPATGLSRLVTSRVSQASANQRRGRAGRLGPGLCYRLWEKGEQGLLRPADTPEILEADLLPLALDLLAWGASVEELKWLDPPAAGPYNGALDLGRRLGLISEEGGLTQTAEEVLRLPVHPRLGVMLLESRRFQNGPPIATTLAAILEEGDPVRSSSRRNDPDLEIRLAMLHAWEEDRQALADNADRSRLRRISAEKKRIMRVLKSLPREKGSLLPPASPARLLATAYPDRIGVQRREGGARYLMSGGRPVRLAREADPRHRYLVIPSAGGTAEEGIVELALPMELEEIEEWAADQIVEEVSVSFNTERGRAEIVAERRLGSATLTARPVQNPDDRLVVRAILQEIATTGLDRLPWTRESTRLRERLQFLHRYWSGREGADPAENPWPDLSDAGLLSSLEEWLTPLLLNRKGKDRLSRLNMSEALRSLLGWEELASLDKLAPERYTVPSGSAIRIDYSRPEEPVLPVRLQEMYGSHRNPGLLDGRVPLTLHLLSPAGRPVQVTRDLSGFWKGSYAEVRKEMKGRYPKHFWPDNPGEAEPRRGVRK